VRTSLRVPDTTGEHQCKLRNVLSKTHLISTLEPWNFWWENKDVTCSEQWGYVSISNVGG